MITFTAALLNNLNCRVESVHPTQKRRASAKGRRLCASWAHKVAAGTQASVELQAQLAELRAREGIDGVELQAQLACICARPRCLPRVCVASKRDSRVAVESQRGRCVQPAVCAHRVPGG